MPRNPSITSTSGRNRPAKSASPALTPALEEPRWLKLISARPALTLILATIAVLLPFIARPLNIDDPMYVWAAQQIRAHPLDFYGFSVFWAGAEQPMQVHMQNPPLACYYIALVSLIAGFGEVVLHLAFMIPAVGLVLGTYQLARSMCHPPAAALAALLIVVMPVFVLCANTVTNDVLMVCLWVWAVVLWDRGLRVSHWPSLLASSALIGAACMAKYPGVNLIPLLAAYTLLRRARWHFLLFLLVPVGVLVAYELLTGLLYERGLLSQAAEYARLVRERRQAEPVFKSFIALCFTGGCLLPVLLLAPVVWRWRALALSGAVAAGVLWVLRTDPPAERIRQITINGEFNWLLAVQIALWATVGLGVFAGTAADLWRRRDAQSMLLTLWIVGTFAFAGIINWSVNGRSLLAMAPAVAIVLVRRIEDTGSLTKPWPRRLLPIAVSLSLVMCLLLEWADFSLSRSARIAANTIADKYGHGPGKLWFQGHWGFQHYMQQLGYKPFIIGDDPVNIGDLVIVPLLNANVRMISEPVATQIDVIAIGRFPFLTTMDVTTGAGFYAEGSGPLPFVFGPAMDDQYRILRINVAYDPASRAPASKPSS